MPASTKSPPSPSKLKRRLERQGLTQKMLAHRTGINEATISRIVNRGLVPTGEQKMAIDLVLNEQSLDQRGQDKIHSLMDQGEAEREAEQS